MTIRSRPFCSVARRRVFARISSAEIAGVSSIKIFASDSVPIASGTVFSGEVEKISRNVSFPDDASGEGLHDIARLLQGASTRVQPQTAFLFIRSMAAYAARIEQWFDLLNEQAVSRGVRAAARNPNHKH